MICERPRLFMLWRMRKEREVPRLRLRLRQDQVGVERRIHYNLQYWGEIHFQIYYRSPWA